MNEMEPWLRGYAPVRDAESWRALQAQIMAAAEPELAALRVDDGAWVGAIGAWWTRAAGGLAVAATLLFMIMQNVAPSPGAGAQPNVLQMIADDGQPRALWRAYGIEADPVLALITTTPTAGAQ